jgi:uncharacterized protein YneF (UPF0154 family)
MITTLDCYHEALDSMGVYIIMIVFLSGLIGLLIGYFNEFKITIERKRVQPQLS